MGTGSRGGGEDAFGCGRLVGRISPGFLVKVDGEVLLLGRRGNFEDLPVPEPVVADETIVAMDFYWQAQVSRYLRRLQR